MHYPPIMHRPSQLVELMHLISLNSIIKDTNIRTHFANFVAQLITNSEKLWRTITCAHFYSCVVRTYGVDSVFDILLQIYR